ncbi:MAG: hypothetical protein UMU76_05460 [Prosthecochloris sp.]|nr:hypothetical protein [Prosthecochloris sp.]
MKQFRYSEIVMAFEFVSSDEEGENFAWVCRDTGEIVYFSEKLGLDERRGQDIHSGNCFPVPHREALELGRELAFDFIDEVLPGDYAEVRDIFADPEASRSRFRDMLAARGRLDDWKDYEADRISDVLRQWCEARGIELADQDNAV